MAANLPPEVVDFWRRQVEAQEPWKGLTGSPEWFMLMAEGSVKPAVVVVARDEDGGIVAVVPVLFQTMRLGRKRVGVARVCGGDWIMDHRPLTIDHGPLTEECLHRATSASQPPETPHPNPPWHAGVPEAKASGRRRLPQWHGQVPPHPSPLPQGERVQMGEGWLAGVWNAIVEYDPEVEAIVLDHVDESRIALVRDSCEWKSGFFLHTRAKLMPHYRMVLPPSYEDFRTLRSASSLKKIEGRERAMAREVGGECLLVEIRQPDDWAPYALEINRLMNTTWQATRLGHGFDIEKCRPIAERGWLRSFLLLAGTRPAAFVLGYQGSGFAAAVAGCQVAKLLSESPKDPALSSSTTEQLNNLTTEQRAKGAVFHYEQIGHDAGLAKYSPGTILLYRLIQRLYEKETPGCVDFGEGEAEYKKTLANNITYAQSVMVVRSRVRWRVRFGVMGLKHWARGAARGMADKWGVRKRIAKYLKYRS